jgi:hypothetical protein
VGANRPLNIPVALFLPIFVIALFFVVIAKETLYRPHYELPQVIHFVRNLNVVELAELLDPHEEWALRTLNSPDEFRKLQRERIRLAFEYLRRLGHNAEVIQSWAMDLRKGLHGKAPEDFTIQDRLVCELVELSTDLRIYNLVATVKVALWVVLRMHLWPMGHVPRISDLRTIGDLDVVKRYRSLVEAAATFTESYGEVYSRQLLDALS